MLIIGSITGGIALSRKNSMTNAVREGARLGATLPIDPDDADEWPTAVRDRVLDLAAGDLTASQVCVKLVQAPSTAAIQGTPSCAIAADEPSISGVPAGECAVLVWAKRTSELEVIVWSRDLTLSADAVNRYERDCG
jgi:Flp pilus assembly protein TadG